MEVSGRVSSARNSSLLLPRSPARSREEGGGGGGAGMEALRRLVRRVKPFEHVGLLGFVVFTAALFLSLLCSAHSDYSWVWPGGGGYRGLWVSRTKGGGVERGRSDGSGGGECDWSEGEWVWDEGFRCSENGRSDRFYTKWRWQPVGCDLPRGCYFQEGNDVKREMSVADAYQRSIQTLFEWIHKEVDRRKTHVVFRTHAPVHFRGGDRKTGGNCHLETLPDLVSSTVSSKAWVHLLEPFRNMPLANSTENQALELAECN